MLDFSPLAGGGTTPLIVLAAILVLDTALGLIPGGGRSHLPIVGMEGLFSSLEERLNRGQRKRAIRILRGAAVCAAGVGGAAVLGWLAWWGASRIPFGFLVDAAVLAVAVSQRVAISAMVGTAEGLRSDDPTYARFALSAVLPSSPSRADSAGLARIAIEEGALGFLRRLAVPAFWYVVGGLPGVFVYAVLLVMVPPVRPLDPAARDFGAVGAVFRDAYHYLPARIAALTVLLASAFVSQADASRARAALSAHRRHFPDINGGWLVAPVAGALDLALCGPETASETGRPTAEWVGEGRTEAGDQDIRAAAGLLAVAALILVALVAVLIPGTLV